MSLLSEQPASPSKRSAAAAAAIVSIGWQQAIPAIAICLVLLRSRIRLLLQPLPVYDFMTYWGGGRLFLSGANPYNGAAMYAIERSLGWSYVQSLVLLNPPWALPFVALIGIPPFLVARHIWLAASLVIEAGCAMVLWKYFGGATRKLWMALVVVLTFLPAGAAEHMGQITPLMLAGLTAFLVLARQRRDLLAGACLIAVGFKPHLLYLVVFAILLWIVETRRWKIAIGAVAIYAGSSVGAILFNHTVLGYFHGATQAALDTSCGVGGVLRTIFGVQHTWLQFVPTVIGIAWFAYWRRHHREWSWEARLPLLLLVSIATAPYSWAHDYILALPSFVALTVALAETDTDWLIPSAFYLVVQIVIFTVTESVLPKIWTAATSLLWLLLYWGGTRYLASVRKAPIAAQVLD